MNRLFSCVTSLLVAIIVNAGSVWCETFDKNGTNIQKSNYGSFSAWPYASQWFTGYTGENGTVVGSQYVQDYDSVASYHVTIRGKNVDGISSTIPGLYFVGNKDCYVTFYGVNVRVGIDAQLVLTVCNPNDNVTTNTNWLHVFINGEELSVPSIVIQGELVSQQLILNLPSQYISTLKISMDNQDNPLFISRMEIIGYTWKLSVLSNPLEGGVVTGGGLYLDMSNVSISALPDSGFRFTQWSDGNIDNPRTVLLTKDSSFTAQFDKIGYCGENLFWQYSNSVLNISGSGSMRNYSPGAAPWLESFQDSIVSITINDGCTSVGSYAFFNCSRTRSITIPISLTNIEQQAFSCCDSIVRVLWNATNCNGYNFGNQVELFNFGDNVNVIPANICKGMSKLMAITIPQSVSCIKDSAFLGCDNKEFKVLDLPNNILSIGKYAFANCAWLKNVTLGTNLEEIGNYAFTGDSRLLYINCYAAEPPLLGTLPFANYNAYLKIPCDVKDEYRVSLGWSSFYNTSCIAAEEVVVTEIQSEPTSTSVEIAWPAVSGADNYTIEVKQGSKVICTIIFNAQGQLLSINFPTSAPARGIANAQEAVATATGWAYTINGLTPGTAYTYSVVAKDAGGNVLDTKNGSFETTSPTAIENVNDNDNHNGNKVIRNDILIIERNGIYYNAQGAVVE